MKKQNNSITSLMSEAQFTASPTGLQIAEGVDYEAWQNYGIKLRAVQGALQWAAEYLRFSDLSQWPVWLLFLHLGGQAKDSPPSPSGLYGGNLSELKNHISHTHENFGKSGGVFWNIAHLKKLANVEDL